MTLPRIGQYMSTPSYFCLCLNERVALVHSAAPVIQEATFLFLGKIYAVVDYVLRLLGGQSTKKQKSSQKT